MLKVGVYAVAWSQIRTYRDTGGRPGLEALVPQSDVCLLRLLGTPSLQHKCLSWEDAEHAPGPAAVGEPKCSQQF